MFVNFFKKQKMGNDREERSSESRIRELEGHREDSWWITQGVIFEGGVSQFCLHTRRIPLIERIPDVRSICSVFVECVYNIHIVVVVNNIFYYHNNILCYYYILYTESCLHQYPWSWSYHDTHTGVEVYSISHFSPYSEW